MEVVTGAMGSLLPKLGQLLMDKYNLHKRVKKDVEFLRKELESMQAALIKVGEVPRDQLDRQVKLWADEVNELSYNMEDAVDKFLVRVDGIQPHDEANRLKGLLKRMIGVFKKGRNHHPIADGIQGGHGPSRSGPCPSRRLDRPLAVRSGPDRATSRSCFQGPDRQWPSSGRTERTVM